MQFYEQAQSFRTAIIKSGMDPEDLSKMLTKDFQCKESYFELVKDIIPKKQARELQRELYYSEALLSFVRSACLV